jgi:hypothetical protein
MPGGPISSTKVGGRGRDRVRAALNSANQAGACRTVAGNVTRGASVRQALSDQVTRCNADPLIHRSAGTCRSA